MSRHRISRGSSAFMHVVLAALASLAVGLAARPSTAASGLSSHGNEFDMRALDGYEAAQATARGWEPDAAPSHVEPADSLHEDGSAAGWTYVFWSETARLARAYTVRRIGTITVADLAFPFDPPPLEGGWQDATDALERVRKDPRAIDAMGAGGLAFAMLTRGLGQTPPGARDAIPRSTWVFAFGGGAGARELVVDALRGTVIEEHNAPPLESRDGPAGALAGGRTGLPPWLASHATLALTRLGALRDLGIRGARARWLEGREGASLARLASQDAALDTLGRARLDAETATLDQRLAGLTAWRTQGVFEDSTLARGAQRVDACLRDLALQGPTGIAVYLSVSDHARPARVSVFVDGVETARVGYADAEWRALDAGAWAEAARVAVRPGRRVIRVDIESADHRVDHASWQAAVTPGRLALLHLSLSGTRREAGGPAPTLESLAASAP